MDLSITQAEFIKGQMARENGALIQDAFPQLSADEREFIMTGTPPAVWDEIFAESTERGSYAPDDLAASDRNERYYMGSD